MALKTTTEFELTNEAPKLAVLTRRIDIIDIVRGVALLGILILNNSNNLKNHGMLFMVSIISSLFPLTAPAQEKGPQYFAYLDCDQTEINNEIDQRPNIVLIVADDLGFGDIGCYSGEMETPDYVRPFAIENFGLYDLSNDIGEQNDLKEKEPKKYKELMKEWTKFSDEIRLQMATPSND